MTSECSSPRDLSNITARHHRLVIVDFARGAAIVAMVFFHFVRDLEIFGVLAAGTTLGGGWAILARTIAGSFMLLVGVSLVLAHGQSIRWAAFVRRGLMIGAAASAVTLATYFATPEKFVYFGILHAIFLASIIGIFFVRARAWISFSMALGVLAIWLQFGRSLDLEPWMGWSGLSSSVRPSLDLIPVFPFLAPTLLGIAFTKTIRIPGTVVSSGVPVSLIAWLGRHSLAIYLLHQPLLIGAMWLAFRV